MTDGKAHGEREAEQRARRAAAALRENLKRRKAQERARRQAKDQKAKSQKAQGVDEAHESAGFAPDKSKV